MKRKLILLILTLFLMFNLEAMGGVQLIGGGVTDSFCSGITLFCETFEGDDNPEVVGGEEPDDGTWDATAGTYDCTFDANGDFCDDYTTAKNGTEAFGAVGQTGNVSEGFSSSSTEFHFEFWFRTGDVTTTTVMKIRNSGGGTKIVTISLDADSTLLVKINNDTTSYDSGTVLSVDTWYHIGVYYKEEVSGDGIVRCWITESNNFAAVDLDINITTAVTGTTAGESILLLGPSSGAINFIDDIRVKSGEPSWPTA